jgi:hypothetical protein
MKYLKHFLDHDFRLSILGGRLLNTGNLVTD